MGSPEHAARWLAAALDQLADLHERDLFPHQLVRMDAIAADPEGLAKAIGDLLQMPVPAMPPEVFRGPTLPSGEWRRFAEPLAEAFALLAPVARRLGYAD